LSYFQALFKGLEQTKARTVDLEVANRKLDSVLEQKRNINLDLISQLEQCELEMKNMDGILCEIQDACGKRQEDIKRVQEQLQAKEYVQSELNSFDNGLHTFKTIGLSVALLF
jgi:predicted RNase H-like nuclease (RuvC/YqgF family)